MKSGISIIPSDFQNKESLINIITTREVSITNSKRELILLWFNQGKDLMELQKQENCSQNKLTLLTGISKASVYTYIKIAKDDRLLSILTSDHHGGHLECFNQKNLLQLTKLNDSQFEQSITAGTIINANKVTSANNHIKKNIQKPVMQLDLNHKEVARYPSAAIAQKITGISRMSIGKICRKEKGRTKAGNHYWKFAI